MMEATDFSTAAMLPYYAAIRAQSRGDEYYVPSCTRVALNGYSTDRLPQL